MGKQRLQDGLGPRDAIVDGAQGSRHGARFVLQNPGHERKRIHGRLATEEHRPSASANTSREHRGGHAEEKSPLAAARLSDGDREPTPRPHARPG
jgi:hypothetical protein